MSTAVSASLYAGIVTSRLEATCAFYTEHFGFSALTSSPDYVLLGRVDGARLAVLRVGSEGQPAALNQPTRGSGLWLTFAGAEVETMHARLIAHGVEIVADPEYTASGEHRCVVRDPNGILVYITRSVPSSDFSQPLQATHQGQHHDEHHSYRVRRISSNGHAACPRVL